MLAEEVLHLADRMAPIAGVCELRQENAAALTRPAFFDPADLLVNVDNVLLAEARVAEEPAVVVALAHGNYKDNACALASAAAMVAASELATSFLSEADVGPALQRALLSADARIREVGEGPLPREKALLDTCVGRRQNLRGIGCSMIAAVVTTRHVFVAHCGECRAVLVEDGRAKHLVQPHLFSNTKEGRAAVEGDPSLREHYADIVTRVLGLGDVRIELTRAPFAAGARLVIGNPALARVTDFSGAPAEAVVRIADALAADARSRWLPATLAIVG